MTKCLDGNLLPLFLTSLCMKIRKIGILIFAAHPIDINDRVTKSIVGQN